MRVLLIGPLWANKKHGAEVGIYEALQELGVDAVAYDPRERIYDDPMIPQPARIEPEDFAPPEEFDFVLCPGPGAAARMIPVLQRIKGPKVLWNSEPIRLQSYRDKVASQKGLWDHTFTFDESELELYAELGIHAGWLPQAFNPRWYRPLEDEETIGDLCFVGSIGGKWAHRERLLRRLQREFRVSIGTLFDAEVVNRHYNCHKLVLNLGLYCSECGDQDQLRAFGLQQRIFESIGAGRVCVTNEIPAGTNELFRDGEEIVTYDSRNLEEKIECALKDEVRCRIESNLAEIRGEHTYAARMRQLIEELS